MKMGNSVDGVHYLHEEPRPFTTTARSFKFGKQAGLAYEVCIATNRPEITWLNGPFLAGEPDLTMSHDKLVEAIEKKQRDRGDPDIRVLADDGYIAQEVAHVFAYRNEMDPREVAYFKDRQLSCHETVNGRSKNFRILDTKFRHDRGYDEDREFAHHKAVTEAVFVTIQIELNLGEYELFDTYPS